MTTISIIIETVLFAGMGFCLFMVWRTTQVYYFRTKLLRSVASAGDIDIRNGKDYIWRFKAYDSVSYDNMMIHFWKPLKPEAWWSDTSFLTLDVLDHAEQLLKEKK